MKIFIFELQELEEFGENSMLPEIGEIKSYRKKLGLTQSELSELSGVSQSLIAKMESGKITPSYDKAKRLFESLQNAGKQDSIQAKDIMTKKFKFVKENDSARKAISSMEKNGFSQVPVIMKENCVGVVTETGVLGSLRGLNGKDFDSLKVKEIMNAPLPIVNEETMFAVLSGILRHEQAVLVSKKGKLTGIITKSDLLKSALVRI